MTILEHLEDLEAEDMRLLASVMLVEAISERRSVSEDRGESEVTHYSGMEDSWVVTEVPERLAVLQSELAVLLDAGCNAQESAYVTQRSEYLAARLEGREN